MSLIQTCGAQFQQTATAQPGAYCDIDPQRRIARVQSKTAQAQRSIVRAHTLDQGGKRIGRYAEGRQGTTAKSRYASQFDERWIGMDKARVAIEHGDSRRQLIQQVQRLCRKGGAGD